MREFCIGILAATGLGVWIFFAVFGNYTLHAFMSNALPTLADTLNNLGNAPAVVQVWATLPMPKVFLFFMLLMTLLATITLLNGTAYTLAISAPKRSPANRNRPAGTGSPG